MNKPMSDTARSGGRIFYGWWIVAAAMVGLSTSPSQFAFASLGLFIVPLGEDFGWNRAEISLALTFFTVTLALCLPLAGRLVDRFGSREVLVPSVLVCGVCLAVLPAVTSLWHLLLIFTVIGSLGAGANSLPYMLTISAWFDRRRGLAIGLAMAGAGFGFAYVPPLVQYMIDNHGWRSGYFALAAITVFVAAPLVALVFRNTPAEKGLQPDGGGDGGREGAPAGDEKGFTVSEALRSRTFWMLWAVFCLLSFSLYGLLPHLVPLLTDQGMPSGEAALAASTVGFTIIGARILIGFLIDRYFAPHVALLFFLMSAAGVAVLAVAPTGWTAFLAAVLVGLSIGAEIDLLAYLTTRYFGLANFGAVYGVMFAALLVGTSAGPVSFGLGYELTGSYVAILLLCAGLNVAASLVTAFLPAYPEFGNRAYAPGV
jgi:MFS family permease